MSEYSNDTFMTLERGGRLSSFAVGFGARAVLQLIQYLRRLQKEHILSEGQVYDAEKFIKATEGKYDIYSVPLQDNPIQMYQRDDIVARLDEMKVHYCILPDPTHGSEKELHILVAKDDLQKFHQFYGAYIRDVLSGGEKSADEIRRFTEDRCSVFSVPEQMVPEMKDAMEKLKVNFAELPDLNLKDGDKQFLIDDAKRNAVSEIYRLLRDNHVKKGEQIHDACFMTNEQYQNTGKESVDDVMAKMNASMGKDVTKIYEEGKDAEKADEIFDAEKGIRSDRSSACMEFRNDPDYLEISVDDATLVNNPDDSLPSQLADGDSRNFFCRIPGTWGENEEVLSVPKEQVFGVKNSGRTRYAVFFKRDEEPMVYSPDFGKVSKYPDGAALIERFDRKNSDGAFTKAQTPAKKRYTAADISDKELERVREGLRKRGFKEEELPDKADIAEMNNRVAEANGHKFMFDAPKPAPRLVR